MNLVKNGSLVRCIRSDNGLYTYGSLYYVYHRTTCYDIADNEGSHQWSFNRFNPETKQFVAIDDSCVLQLIED